MMRKRSNFGYMHQNPPSDVADAKRAMTLAAGPQFPQADEIDNAITM
jgi:hypothetical protein